MKRLSFICLVLCLCGFTPVHDKYDQEQNINDEFRNVENTTQSKQWRVLAGTPTLNDLEDGESVIVSTNGIDSIMWRHNIDIFAVRGSCVTVFR